MSKHQIIKNDKAARSHRFLEGLALHALEGNPLTLDEIEMFAMFEREGWSDAKIRAHIHNLIKNNV